MAKQYEMPEWAWEIYFTDGCPSLHKIFGRTALILFKNINITELEGIRSQLVAEYMGWAYD